MLQLQLTTPGYILRGSTSQWSREKGQPRGNESKPPTSANKPVREQKKNGVVLAAYCSLRRKEVMEILLRNGSMTY